MHSVMLAASLSTICFRCVELGSTKTTVMAPSGHVEAGGISLPPDDSLELEYVYGYSGHSTRDSVHLNMNGHVVYPIAALGVVCDSEARVQKHFKGHNEDVPCLAMHPQGRFVATGQVDPKGAGTPYICIWDSCAEDVKEVARFVYHDRAVISLCFSEDGTKLVSIGADDDHTMAVWDWEKATFSALALSAKEKKERKNKKGSATIQPFARTKTQWLEKAKSVFSSLDTDESGQLNKEELKAAYVRLGLGSSADKLVERLMKLNDTNKDGQVTRSIPKYNLI